jgi:hypothetical protein
VFASPTAAPTVTRPRSPSGDTAGTLILIAFIFQCIASGVVFLVLFYIPFVIIAPVGLAVSLTVLGILGVIGAVAILMLYVAYAYSYRRTKDGNYEGARTPTLILGILGIFFGWIVTGVLYLIAFAKLGDAAREVRGPVFYATPGYYAPAMPYGTPGPVPTGTPMAGGGPAFALPPGPPPPPAGVVCPRCGQPATWVPQYSRYYCYRDAQYL